ncbi:hypothetical protein [Lunatimonas salinarum]|uniref:hypothetical protein n=1 Tax=Lunatimonas salinarum TaxID=1774590 RepID=UPI001AE0B814|nr:hypothetical protein [Lunatimonas salinarum]
MKEKQEAKKEGVKKETLAAAAGAAIVGAAAVGVTNSVFGSDTVSGSPGNIEEQEATVEPMASGNATVNVFQSEPYVEKDIQKDENINLILSEVLQKANLLNINLQNL